MIPFTPPKKNTLRIFPGSLTGSHSPYSGRTNVCAFSPQSYPHGWFRRSRIGARFGGERKREGYDGIVVALDEAIWIRVVRAKECCRLCPVL